MPLDLLELELGQCLVRIDTDWTMLRTPPPLRKPDDDPTSRVIAAMRKRMPQASQLVPAATHDAANEDKGPEFVV